MVRRITLGLVLLGMWLPFTALAEIDVAALEAQIQALLARVSVLQAELKALPSVPVSIQPVASGASSQGFCPTLTRTLRLGMAGPDVSSLQLFLSQDPAVYSTDVTGFFGIQTENAIRKWQASHGLVSSGASGTTGYGQVGPRTRSLIAVNCRFAPTPAPVTAPASICPVALPPTTYCSVGWQAVTDGMGCTTSYKCSIPLPQPSSAPVISSISGPTTLGANQTGTWVVNASDPSGGTLSYSVDWGDSAVPVPAASALPLDRFVQTTTFTHAYSYTGMFTVTVTVRSSSGYTARMTTSVRVGGTASNTFAATLTSGNVPLTVTFSNWVTGGVFEASSYPKIDYGDGSVRENAGTCHAPNDACLTPGINTHVYETRGTYTAQLFRTIDGCAGWTSQQYACTLPAQNQILGSITIVAN